VGLFGSLGKLVGKGLKLAKGAALSSVPGGSLVQGAISGATKIAGRIGRKNLKRIAVGAAVATVAGGTLVGGRGGGGGVMTPTQAGRSGMAGIMGGRSRRRINPGNAKAMRRAISRVNAGARMFGRFFAMKKGTIKGAHGVRVKKVSFARKAA
jgi:hypothetical protein